MTKRKLTLNRFIELCKEGLAYLYCIKLYNDQESFYKVGITSRKDIFSRFSSIPYNCELICAYSHPSSTFVFDLERKLLKLGIKYQPLIEFGGCSECISEINTVLQYLESLNWISELSLVAVKKQKSKKVNFGAAVKQYAQARYQLANSDLYFLSSEEKGILEEVVSNFESDPNFEIVLEYIEIFGFSQELKDFSEGYLRESYLIKKIDKYKESLLLTSAIKSKFSSGEVYPNQRIKEILEHIYSIHSLSGKPKLTDLELAFKTTPTTITSDGKRIKALRLYLT